jgi:hypothetical protein
VGPHGQVIVDPREPREAPWFVRVMDLGGVVAFVPTSERHDGDKNIDPGVDYWDRKQYVVGCRLY